METQEIRLERSEEHPNQEVLVGLNGDLEIDERITRAVEKSGRLFPYVVQHIAQNRVGELGQVFASEDSGHLTDHMRSVRDELNFSVRSLREARRQARLQQAANLTVNVRPERPPYFAR
jgi:hypothetical protein